MNKGGPSTWAGSRPLISCVSVLTSGALGGGGVWRQGHETGDYGTTRPDLWALVQYDGVFFREVGDKDAHGRDHVRTGRGGGGPPAEEGGRRGNRPRRPRARRLPASGAARTPISVFQGSQSGVLSCGTPAKVRPEKVGELGTEGQEMRGRHV